MKYLKLSVRILSVIPCLTGLLDLVLGVKAMVVSGGMLHDSAVSDASLNSQIRFFGAIWLGIGVLLWRCSADLKVNASLFQTIVWILILSGVGRLMSFLQFGMPSPPLFAAMLLELLGMPLLLWWHAWVLKQTH
jgi:xanthosine utilization system XapX-like protein